MPPLSQRLKAVVSMVTKGNTAADIGCDHGYTAIALRLSGVSPACICSDIGAGPLAAARENIAKYGVNGIRTVCADGLSGVGPGEAMSIIIAGMGGELICRILEEGKDTALSAKELILGPQSEAGRARECVSGLGFCIADERLVFEDGKFYPLIRAERGAGVSLSEAEKTYGPVLLANRDAVLGQYLEKERAQLERALGSISANGSDSPGTIRRREELKALIGRNDQAREYYQ